MPERVTVNTAFVLVASDTVTELMLKSTGVGGGGPSAMVIVPEPVPTVALVVPVIAILKDSAGSLTVLASTVIDTVLVVSPGANVTVPLALV